MAGSTSATYAYNADGLRMSKTVSGSTSHEVWDLAEGAPVMLSDGTNSYVTGADGLPLEQITSSSVTYLYQDQLGSTRGLLDGSGAIVGTYTYGPFGDTRSHTGTATTPFQYAGQYTDSESGLQYLRVVYSGATAGEGGIVGWDAHAGTGTRGQQVTIVEPSAGLGPGTPWPFSVHASANNTYGWSP